MESIILDPVKFLSENLGAGDATIRLILSLLAGYPLAFIYRLAFFGRDENLQHRYFIVSGLALCYFNFGGDSIHSVITITLIWLLLKTIGGTALSVVLSFVINTLYLMSAYIHVTGDDYDISWATPQCVLSLRLTGVVFDVYDGKKKQEKLSKEQKETALPEIPSLLEMAGHVYFFGGFLAGPQFSMKRYKNFVEGKYGNNHVKGPPQNIQLALLRLLGGLMYIALFQVLSALYFTNSYMLSNKFESQGLLSKCIYISIWGKLHICKYVGCWLVAEGSCMLTGLTYNGKDINGNMLWNGCSNAKIYELETATTFREMIAGFNVITNEWMSKGISLYNTITAFNDPEKEAFGKHCGKRRKCWYVFKRLKFLGSIQISQAATLLYLAVWHGLHSGYYMNFFLEFIMLNGETQLADVISRIPSLQRLLKNVYLRPFVFTTKKLLLNFFVSYALVSFVQLKWKRYSQVYSSLLYIGHVIFFVLPILCLAVKLFLRPKKSHANGVHNSNKSSAAQIQNGEKMKVN